MEEEIVGEDRGTSTKEIPDGGVTDRFGALFTCPIGARIARQIRRTRLLPVMASRVERQGC